MMDGCVLLTQTLLFAVVTATLVLALLLTHGFFSPRSQYVVTLPFPLKKEKQHKNIFSL
jgi:hypothetical protein